MFPTQLLYDVLRRYDVEATKQLRNLVVFSITHKVYSKHEEPVLLPPALLPLSVYNILRHHKEELSGKDYMRYGGILHGLGVIDKHEEVWMPHIKDKFYSDVPLLISPELTTFTTSKR